MGMEMVMVVFISLFSFPGQIAKRFSLSLYVELASLILIKFPQTFSLAWP